LLFIAITDAISSSKSFRYLMSVILDLIEENIKSNGRYLKQVLKQHPPEAVAV